MKYFLFAALLVQGSCAQSCFSMSKGIDPQEVLNVPDAFRKYKIVADYLPVPPNDLFLGGHDGYDINLGTYMPPLATMGPIHLRYPNGVPGENYVAVLLDIDSPSRDKPENRAYIHALFVNSPPDDILKGEVVVPFTPAIPPLNTGVHRYVGLLYKQNGAMDPDSKELLRLAKNRSGFSAVDFARRYNLGDPVAGNFFVSSAASC